jgi:hypothetical protein
VIWVLRVTVSQDKSLPNCTVVNISHRGFTRTIFTQGIGLGMRETPPPCFPRGLLFAWEAYLIPQGTATSVRGYILHSPRQFNWRAIVKGIKVCQRAGFTTGETRQR